MSPQPTVGSLCTGIGGAELALGLMGLNPAFLWYSEVDRDASAVLAKRFPDVPNLGDLRAICWERTPRVDVLTAGYPCQGESLAGKRLGADDERWIWPYIARAIRVLRPRVVLAENVAAHLSLGFGTVLRDLAALGFDVEWTTFRASDIGACHQRDRIFWAATDSRCAGERAVPGVPRGDETHEDAGGVRRTVTSLSVMAKQAQIVGQMTNKLLPTPGVSGGGQARNMTANRSNPDSKHHSGTTLADVAYADLWGKYLAAVDRWGEIVGRLAPAPTDDEGRLSSEFVEWMMGYEAGWVTEVETSRTGQLRCLGNAIVPQQATAAWAHLLGFDSTLREREGLLPTPRTSNSHGAGSLGTGS